MRFVFLVTVLFCSCSKTNCLDIGFTDGISYKNGKKFTGNCESFHPNGNLKSIQTYKKGLDHGEWIFYFPSGNIQTKGTFNEGVRIGKWEYFHENSSIWKEQFYDSKGDRVGVWNTYDLSGDKIEATGYSILN